MTQHAEAVERRVVFKTLVPQHDLVIASSSQQSDDARNNQDSFQISLSLMIRSPVLVMCHVRP